MKKFLVLTLLVLSAAAYAIPDSTFNATPPTQYVDGNPIPGTDVLTYTVFCSSNQGGPYNFSYPANSIATGEVIDISTCVQGVPGTYYFVATATSTDFGSESQFSNESTRTYTANELGKVPNAPTLLTIQ